MLRYHVAFYLPKAAGDMVVADSSLKTRNAVISFSAQKPVQTSFHFIEEAFRPLWKPAIFIESQKRQRRRLTTGHPPAVVQGHVRRSRFAPMNGESNSV